MTEDQHQPGDIQSLPLYLWDDNPSSVDLLGFDAVVALVPASIAMPDLDPLPIGVHGPWGGGKPTILGLIASDLRTRPMWSCEPTRGKSTNRRTSGEP